MLSGAAAACKANTYTTGGASLTEFLADFAFSFRTRAPTMQASESRIAHKPIHDNKKYISAIFTQT
jgi:hypothetical protein